MFLRKTLIACGVASLVLSCSNELPEICDNTIDDDNNGLIDCDDAACGPQVSCVAEVCDNNLDDNDDGAIDCEDATCAAAPLCATEICDNNLDDDSDGAIDCDDTTCAPLPICGVPVEVCDNGLDDDFNNRIDCEDAACFQDPVCAEPVEVCGNGLDDDFNGAIDCEDEACADDPFCFKGAEICDNGIDDDGNGAKDCDDPACAQFCAGGSNADTDVIRGVEADIFNGTAAFDTTTINLGAEAAVFAAVVSDQPDSCALLTGGPQPADFKRVLIIGLDFTQTDPSLAFAAGTDFAGDGFSRFAIAAMQVSQNGAVSATANSEQTAAFSIIDLNVGVSASGFFADQLTQDFTVEAEFDTDVDGDGVLDFLLLSPAVKASANFNNATNCPGLANALLGF